MKSVKETGAVYRPRVLIIISTLRYEKTKLSSSMRFNMYLPEREVIKSLASCFQGLNVS